MKKVFLASFGLGGLKDFINEPLESINVAFIPTAADTYKDKWFVEKDREYLKKLGFKLTEVDIKNNAKKEIIDVLNNVQMIYITGGNTFYLLEKIYAKGLDSIIKKLVDEGVTYVGSSAGTVVAGIDIAPIAPIDKPEEAPDLKTTKGLGLVEFVVLPHAGKEKHAKQYQKIIDDYKNKYKVIPINDEQAIAVQDDDYKIIKSE